MKLTLSDSESTHDNDSNGNDTNLNYVDAYPDLSAIATVVGSTDFYIESGSSYIARFARWFNTARCRRRAISITRR